MSRLSTQRRLVKYRDTLLRQALSMLLTDVPKSLVGGEQLGSAPGQSRQGGLRVAWGSELAPVSHCSI